MEQSAGHHGVSELATTTTRDCSEDTITEHEEDAEAPDDQQDEPRCIRKHRCKICCSCCILSPLLVFSILVLCAIPAKIDGRLERILETAKPNPLLSDLYGDWIIDNEIHPFTAFALKQDRVIEVHETEKHSLGCSACHHANTRNLTASVSPSDIYASSIVGAIQLYVPEATLRTKKKPWYFRWIKDDGYKVVLHANGIIKFVPIGDSFMHKLMLARTDSQSWWDWFKNLVHGKRFGCFCLGILTKDGQITRYNRWNNDVEYFYTANKKDNAECAA